MRLPHPPFHAHLVSRIPSHPPRLSRPSRASRAMVNDLAISRGEVGIMPQDIRASPYNPKRLLLKMPYRFNKNYQLLIRNRLCARFVLFLLHDLRRSPAMNGASGLQQDAQKSRPARPQQAKWRCVLCSVRGASERSENAAGGLFQHSARLIRQTLPRSIHRRASIMLSSGP